MFRRRSVHVRRDAGIFRGIPTKLGHQNRIAGEGRSNCDRFCSRDALGREHCASYAAEQDCVAHELAERPGKFEDVNVAAGHSPDSKQATRPFVR